MGRWIEKQRHIIDFTLSSLLRRKRKNAVLILVYTLIVFMLASVIFFVQSIKREAAIILRDSPDIIVQRMSAGRHELIPVVYAEKIRTIRGISVVKARLWGYYYDPVVGSNYTLMVPDNPNATEDGIIIGAGVARTRLVSRGDTMEFRAYDGNVFDLTVGSTISAESEMVSSDLVLVSNRDFRRLFGMSESHATDLVVSVTNTREIPTVALKIAGLLPDTRQLLKEEILRTYEAVFDWRGGMMIVILTGSMLAFIILAWDKASGLSSEERREIGVLKAIGWETSEVLLMKFWEGFMISILALLSGVLLAYFHVFFTSSVLFESALKGWAVLYPRFKLLPFIDPFQMTALFILAVVPYTVATIFPAWRAATIDPDTVMR
jgi:ABC-type lipoprotein release transport system permease subunit